MKTLFLLAAALVIAGGIAGLPPALALNCTLYEGEQQEICGVIEPLELNDDEKEALMQPSIYGESEQSSEPIVLSLNLPNEQPIILDALYEQNVERAWQILLITFIHYFAYSFATKSSTIIQWLRVGS